MISSGTILMGRETLRPQCFQLEDNSASNTWLPVKHSLAPNELEKELWASGWTFFYIANQITTTAFGFDREKMIHRALKHLITDATLQKCNCLEIDTVATHSFLGIPYVSISAHPRHIQKGMVFSGQ